jgi:hypothetical protein
MADLILPADVAVAMPSDVLASLHDHVFTWERMLRGASSILQTITDCGMLAS